MSAADLAVVLISAAALAALVVLVVAAMSLLRSLRELNSALADLRKETGPLLDELRSTVSHAGAEVERVEGLLDAADAISANLQGASRLSYLAFRSPLIRLVSLLEGIRAGVLSVLGGKRSRRRAERRADRARRRAA